jgi:acid phosphatase
MPPPQRRRAAALAVLVLAAAGVLAVAAPARAAARRAPPAPGTSGVVVADGGRVVQGARVCVDRDGDARCTRAERPVRSDARGRFRLRARGPLVAEVGRDAVLVAADGTRTPVRRPFVLRAPDTGATGARAVGPLATEAQSIVDDHRADAAPLAAAQRQLQAQLGLPESAGIDLATADFLQGGDGAAAVSTAVAAEQSAVMDRLAEATAEAGAHGDRVAALANRLDLAAITNVVVIYAENRSFDNVFAHFPGARGVGPGAPQRDRDGRVLDKLPPVWGGLTAAGQPVVVTQAQTTNVLPNAPFQVDAEHPAWGGPALPNTILTRDLYHRFFENQMQIHGGANDGFAAWGDSGGLVMGWFDGSRTALWQLARQYTLADAFFQGAFGGSFLNHQYLVCACLPDYPDADAAPAKPSIAVLVKDAAGRWTHELAVAPNSPPSALAGPPVFVKSGNLTPRDYLGDGTFHAVNTMQPPFQPSGNPPAADEAAGLHADPLNATTLPVQTRTTIGDLLDARGIGWAWYSGGWSAASADRRRVYDDAAGNFQAHHQPFNYYAALDPVAHPQARAAHLKDEADFVAAAAAGTLPAVAFYKPIGADNEHPGYASLARGDAHIADLVARLQASPQWPHMLIVVTYDENGGQWDAVAPPQADLLGPGTRIPAVVISPFARRGYVDHTPYDTGSIVRFLAHRFSLPLLDGLKLRDAALIAHGAPPMGDLTNALDLRAARGDAAKTAAR